MKRARLFLISTAATVLSGLLLGWIEAATDSPTLVDLRDFKSRL